MSPWLLWLVFSLVDHLWLRIEFAGDIALGRSISNAIERMHARAFFSSLRLHLKGTDIAFANLEGSVRVGGIAPRASGYDLSFGEAALPVLSWSGVTHLGLSNNHALDGGPASRERTREALGRLGVTGFHGVHHIACKGVELAVIACDRTRSRGREALHTVRREAKKRLTFVFPHLGLEDTDLVTAEDRAFLRACLEAGAAGVFGHHPHRVKAGGPLLGRPGYPSLGSLVFDRSRSPDCFGLLVRVHVWAGTPVAWEEFIVHIRPGSHQPVVWPWRASGGLVPFPPRPTGSGTFLFLR